MKTNEIKHTELPWRLWKANDDTWAICETKENGRHPYFATVSVGNMWGDEGKANAAFIVKAVNNHEKLLEALNDIISESENHGCGSDTMSESLDEVRRVAIKAIKEAV